MRLAFEEVTGQDMNWFWNQWYYGSGHPKLKIDYAYDDAKGKAQVIIEQTQKTGKIFRLPITIDIYNGKTKVRNKVWMENQADTFTFNYTVHPDLINVDADKVLLCEKTDNKTEANFIHQLNYAPNYLDRKEALNYFNKKSLPQLGLGLKDKYAGLRRETIEHLSSNSTFSKDPEVIKAIESLVGREKDKKTLAAAIRFLVKTEDAKYLPVFTKYVGDSSYSVAAAALNGLNKISPDKAYEMAKKYSKDAKGALGSIVFTTLMKKGEEADFDVIANCYNDTPPDQEKFSMSTTFCDYLVKINDIVKIKKGIDYIMKFRNIIPEQYRGFTDPAFKGGFDKLGKAKGAVISDYIEKSMK